MQRGPIMIERLDPDVYETVKRDFYLLSFRLEYWTSSQSEYDKSARRQEFKGLLGQKNQHADKNLKVYWDRIYMNEENNQLLEKMHGGILQRLTDQDEELNQKFWLSSFTYQKKDVHKSRRRILNFLRFSTMSITSENDDSDDNNIDKRNLKDFSFGEFVDD
ncbi:38612_t:CDS:2 [Gigaspora margarita]|uniref:38612_t:CDS:1 n=1 Tax=Gigaspora margarita TaxID=4874 RepID=A0ABN7V0H4_GIGMA|nr:38612_t:CDS:2 [Gigaspora margarita]